MKKIVMFAVVSLVGYFGYFFFVLKPVAGEMGGDLAQIKGGQPVGAFDKVKNALGGQKSAPANMGLTQYEGMGFPEKSAYMRAPNPAGAGKITVDGGYIKANLLLELRHQDRVVGAAFVRSGEKIELAQLPEGDINVLITDVGNRTATTTRSFSTQQGFYVTPYYENGVILYRAEAHAK